MSNGFDPGMPPPFTAIEVQPKGDGHIRVAFTYTGDCVCVDTLRPIEALKLARELSATAAQLTAFAVAEMEGE